MAGREHIVAAGQGYGWVWQPGARPTNNWPQVKEGYLKKVEKKKINKEANPTILSHCLHLDHLDNAV
eukprot:120391-Lingulodinium_polyedra.AAC.1